MTDKETIINKVNVNRCSVYKNGLCLISKEKCNAKCDYAAYYLYEQLERKEQECEEMKRKVELMMDCPDCKVDEYEKALEEIEKELKEDVYCESQECGCDDFEECLKCTKEHILDIISKAKEGE